MGENLMGTIITDPALLAKLNAPADEFPLLDPSTVAGRADIYRDEQMKNRSAYREVFDEASGGEQFMAGVGKPVMELGAGLMDLVGLGSDESRQESDMMAEQHGGYATAGNIVGEVALAAVPAGQLAKGVQAVTRGAPRLARTGATLTAESGLVGAIEGGKLPGEGETRAENAAEAAKWSMALGVPFAGLQGATAPVSKAAKELLDEGVPLTPGQVGGGMRTSVEKFMSVIPGLSGKVQKMQDAALDSWNVNTLNKVVPLRPEGEGRLAELLKGQIDDVTVAGHPAFTQLQQQFKDAYTEVWMDVTPTSLRPGGFIKGMRETASLLDGLPADSLPAAQKSTQKLVGMMEQFKQSGDYRLIENMDDVLRNTANASDDQLTSKFYQSLRDSLRKGIDPGAVRNLKLVDKSYRDFSVLQKAASYVKPQEQGAIFSPRNLQSAVKAKNDPRLTTTGRGAMQREADAATETIAAVMPGRSEISVGKDIGKWGTYLGVGATGILPGLSVIGGARSMLNEPMRKALTGTPVLTSRASEEAARVARLLGVDYLTD